MTVKKMIAELLNDEYDIVFIKCENINENPMAKLMGTNADETVFLIEPNTVRISEMLSIKDAFKKIGKKIAGVVLMN